MDAQDAQDKEEVRFLHRKLAWAMIRSGVADAQNESTPSSLDQILYILCIHVKNFFVAVHAVEAEPARLVALGSFEDNSFLDGTSCGGAAGG